MNDFKVILNCDVCGMPYQHGPHRYEGYKLAIYGDIACCDSCWRGNSDGWAPHYESVLLAHLKRQKLPVPVRNKDSRLPRN